MLCNIREDADCHCHPAKKPIWREACNGYTLFFIWRENSKSYFSYKFLWNVINTCGSGSAHSHVVENFVQPTYVA